MESLLPAEPASAGTARRFVVKALHELQRERHAEVAELLVSELVTNAVVHARSEVRVRVLVEGEGLRVEVIDASALPLSRRVASAESTSGRGLELVAALSTRWGSERAGDGKTVWFEIDPDATAWGDRRRG